MRLGPGAGEPALQAFVSRLLSEPLPADRPLWSVHFLEHFQGGSAIVARIHHCIGDLARLASGSAGALLGLLALRDDPPTGLKGPLGREKIAAWSRPVDLDDFKAIGRAAKNCPSLQAGTGCGVTPRGFEPRLRP